MLQRMLKVRNLLLLLVVAMTFINAKLAMKRWKQLRDNDYDDDDNEEDDEESEYFDHHWLSRMEERMSERSARVGRVCHKVRSQMHWGGHKDWTERSPDLLLDEGRKVAYCRHGKVATSTILGYFLHLSRKIDATTKADLSADIDNLHLQVPSLYDRVDYRTDIKETRYRLSHNQIYSFSFVRHPFERLYSAYDNKIVHTPVSTINDTKYSDLSASLDADWTRFVDHVLSEARYHCKGGHDCGAMDVHWRPYYSRCSYCSVKYDALGHLETFSEDMAYIAVKSGLHRHLPKNYEKIVANSNQFDYNGYYEPDHYSSPSPKAVQYFRSLDVDRRQRLYSLYELDFQLFGYDPNPYM